MLTNVFIAEQSSCREGDVNKSFYGFQLGTIKQKHLIVNSKACLVCWLQIIWQCDSKDCSPFDSHWTQTSWRIFEGVTSPKQRTHNICAVFSMCKFPFASWLPVVILHVIQPKVYNWWIITSPVKLFSGDFPNLLGVQLLLSLGDVIRDYA